MTVTTEGTDVCSEIDMINMFALWVKKNPSVSKMFETAVQTAPWKSGRLTYRSSGTKLCGNGYILAGDAAAAMMPVYDDGLSAAADSAKAAAGAVIRCAELDDFCGDALRRSCETAAKTEAVSGRPLRSDELKAYLW